MYQPSWVPCKEVCLHNVSIHMGVSWCLQGQRSAPGQLPLSCTFITINRKLPRSKTLSSQAPTVLWLGSEERVTTHVVLYYCRSATVSRRVISTHGTFPVFCGPDTKVPHYTSLRSAFNGGILGNSGAAGASWYHSRLPGTGWLEAV